MKTRRMQFTAWLAMMATTIFTGGCGEPGATTSETAASQAGTNAAPTNASVVAAETADLAVRRSQRTPRALPEEVTRVIDLVESGAGEEVARAYVAASPVAYELSLDDILYLRDIGVSDGVIAAMMRRGGEVREQHAESMSMQTNLVAAVAEIKEALAAATPNAPGTSESSENPGNASPALSAEAPAPQAVQASTAPADAPAEVQPYYDSLSPYGSWYQVPTYGWVWQPSTVAVSSSWAPYCNGGRWLWTDCGWYWCSDYSWGWAPFHYGRWCTYPGLGWCWVPGSVWGPSWVTWRYSGGHVGWAALPPSCGWSTGVGLTWSGGGVSVGFGFGLSAACYTFVPYSHFCSRSIPQHCVGSGQVGTVYNNSTVVNNVINGNNNSIVNNGIGYDKVATLARTEVPKARVEALPGHATQPLRVDRIERARDGMVVYKPTTVEAAGGRPTALRAEVRPAVTSLASSTSIPSRPGYGSRYGETQSPANAKPVETRGVPGRASHGVDGSVATFSPKTVENRSSAPQSRGAVSGAANPASPNAIVGPRRQTTPVPLADPSRNVPSRYRQSVPRTTGAPTASTKSAVESRGASPAVTPNATLPQGNVSRPATSPGVNYGSPSMNARPSRSYSAPVQSTPSRVAPAPASRPSYSAPAPMMNAPRPSYSSPAMSSPRPSYSAPAASGSRPSAPSPSASPSGRSASGGRSQPN